MVRVLLAKRLSSIPHAEVGGGWSIIKMAHFFSHFSSYFSKEEPMRTTHVNVAFYFFLFVWCVCAGSGEGGQVAFDVSICISCNLLLLQKIIT